MRKFLKESEFLRYYLWKYRRWVVVGVFALITVDLLEILPPLLMKYVIDHLVNGGGSTVLAQFALAYVAVSLLQGGCRYLWRTFLIRASMMSGRDIRGSYAGHVFSLGMRFFDRNRTGDLMSLATNDVEAMRMAIGPGFLVFADCIFYLLTVPVAMFFLSPKLTLLAFIPVLLIPPLVLWAEREIHSRFQSVQGSFSKLSAMAQENLSGIRLIKAYAKEDVQVDRFGEAAEEFRHLSLRLARVQSVFSPMLDYITSLGLVLLLVIGGGYVMTDALTLGTLVAFQRYIQKMVWPMMAIGYAITFFQRAVASSKRMDRVMQEKPDPTPAVVAPHAREPGRVEFKKFSFSYSPNFPVALKEISFVVEPGERVALIGPIGSGKTTLLSAVPRLYPIEEGMVYFGGVDVSRWDSKELREKIGFVAQEPFLFAESVSSNLRLGRADADDQILKEFTESSHVHGEILNMPLGYETRLGERGVNISGGQKQRLTIARALVKEPQLLILDDALSAVDSSTETRILSGLERHRHRHTEMISSHRVSTIQSADKIIVLEEGRVVQMGTHSLLIKTAGLYRRFYDQQKLREELELFTREDREKSEAKI